MLSTKSELVNPGNRILRYCGSRLGVFLFAFDLIHLFDQSVDLILPIPQITALNIMLELSLPEPARRIAQLERPQEIARLLEIWPYSDNLVHQILHADDAVLAQMLFDQAVVGQRDALLVDLAVAALIDELTHGFGGRVAVGDEWFNDLQHFGCGFCEADEDAVVDLEETEELEDFAGFGSDFADSVEGA